MNELDRLIMARVVNSVENLECNSLGNSDFGWMGGMDLF